MKQIKQVIGPIIKQLLPLCEDNMTICSPSTDNITCLGWTNRHVTLIQGQQLYIVSGDLSWNNFYGHSPPSTNLRKADVSFWQKYMH